MRSFIGFLLVLLGCVHNLEAQGATERSDKRNKAYGAYFEKMLNRVKRGRSASYAFALKQTFAGRNDFKQPVDSNVISQNITACKVGGRAELVNDPVAYILEAASDKRLLLMNESHHKLSPRFFLYQNLERLWRQGYRHIGFEALYKPVHSLEEFDQMTEAAGAYFKDPLFSGILRKALEIGFRVFPYENTDEPEHGIADRRQDWITRETGQARNIAAYMQTVAGNDKVLIWAGFRHIAKMREPETGELAWMASRLEETHGLSSYSLELTQCSFEADILDTAKMYIENGRVQLSDKAEEWRVDGQLHLPAQENPSAGVFRHILGQPIYIQKGLRQKADILFVRAFKEGQPVTALPYDNVLLLGGENYPLYLPEGGYSIIAYSKDGEELGRYEESVSRF